MMLQKVVNYVENNTPPANNPFVKINVPDSWNGKMPSGKFYAISNKGVITEFESMEEAVDWVITSIIRAKDPSVIHTDRIMKNIMKAIRKKEKYQSYKWRRIKENA